MHIVLVGIVVIFYGVNSFYVKPKLSDKGGVFAFFMINYFNDVGAGVMIAAFANLLFLHNKGKCVVGVLFYLILTAYECVIWEVVRPFVLMLFNPFHKTPKFLWGDMLAYALGNVAVYCITSFLYRVIRNKKTLQ